MGILDCVPGFFPKIRHMRKDDIPEMSALDISTYGGDLSIGEAELRGWYEKYELGAFVLTRKNTDKANSEDEVIGAFGIWPVDRNTYDRCVAGTITEKEVAVVEVPHGEQHGYWYLSDVILMEQLRKKGLGYFSLGSTLIYESLRQWYEEDKMMTNTVRLCAIPISTNKSGAHTVATARSTERLLQSNGFNASASTNEDGCLCYTRMMNEVELKKSYEDYMLKARRCDPKEMIRLMKILWPIASNRK